MRILYAHTSSPTYVRCLKNIDALTEAGHRVHFFGALRVDGPRYSADTFPAREGLTVEMFDGVLPHGARSIPRLGRYIRALRRRIDEMQPELLFLTNEELVLATALQRKRAPLLLDAIDALDIRRKPNSLAERFLKSVVAYARRRADLIIEVEDFRAALRPKYSEKTIVVRNTPSASHAKQAVAPLQDLAPPPFEKYVYACGSLNEHINGIETLVQAAERSKTVKLVVAGFIRDEGLLRLFSDKRNLIRYYGAVSHSTSMALARGSVGIFAHYSPEIRNFVLAAPNKVYEAFSLGKPLLINSECRISSFCEEQGFGLLSPYGAVDALTVHLRSLASDSANKDRLAICAQVFRERYAWEVERRKLTEGVDHLATLCKLRRRPQ